MRTIGCIIVEIDNEYENKRGRFVENVDRDNTFYITRTARVVSAPEFTVLKPGDQVICHHNIFRKKGSVQGHEIHSDYHIEGGRYWVPFTECFMYKTGDGGWVSLSPFCFVKPIPAVKGERKFTLSDQEFENTTHKGFVKQEGVIEYPCKELSHLKGETIIFSSDSEYEFLIDGELYYKMSMNDILAIK